MELKETPSAQGRRWLALRLFIVSLLTNTCIWSFLSLEQINLALDELPRWLKLIALFPVLSGIIGLGYLLLRGLHDLLYHLLPPGKTKLLLVGDDDTNAEHAREFPENGTAAAYAPLWIVAGYLALALLMLLLIGGIAALTRVYESVSHWPSWAVVISVLLVLILLKGPGNRK